MLQYKIVITVTDMGIIEFIIVIYIYIYIPKTNMP